MRGGLSAIQQTLTPEASSVLSHSIAEACRRNHGQTTPLHVAATLLASPTGFLRQACIRSHPNSSHPLQCRALELCFSVALERLPTSQQISGSVSGDPPISNALMAALKRAQAHQRKGCPEQQQQPLLAVKVELEQLIISILDDPSVSRVMREASFSSPAVKAAIEHVLNSQTNSVTSGSRIGLGFRPGPQTGFVLGSGAIQTNRNLYLNPRLQQQQNQQNNNNNQRVDDVKKVIDILTRLKKRNPVLVGESEPREVVKEVLSRIDKDEIQIHDEVLKGVEVISLEKEMGFDREQFPTKINELGGLIDKKMVVNCKGQNGVIIDLGDLKWLVDQPSNQGITEAAREAVTEMGKALRKYGESSKIWFIGTATCETYLRCQVYHPTMENEWDLQVVSIVARPSVPGMLPRLGSSGGILSTSVECLSPMKGFTLPASPLTRRVSENLDTLTRFSCCPQCTEKYGQELAKLEAEEVDKPSSEAKSDGNQQSLPPWLQTAKMHADDAVKQVTDSSQSKEQDTILRQKTQELQKKWSQTCLQLHPSFHHNVSSERMIPSPLSMTGLYNPNLFGRQPFQPKLQQPVLLGDSLQLNIGSPAAVALVNFDRSKCTPGSPVRTELALGPIKLPEAVRDNVQKDRAKVDELHKTVTPVIPGDVDSFKRLLKGLIEKVAWQTDAASAVASTITQCKSDKSKGDTWLLFSGPDRVGKKKMAGALSELVCGSGPIVISLGSRHDGDEAGLNVRGKTAIDRISEAVRRNPNSVILLQDIDEADLLVGGSIKHTRERGRLTDSHGREISLGNIIFIVTSTWTPHQMKGGLSSGGSTINEEKMTSLASGGWQLRISIGEKNTGKRPPSWLNDDQERSTKQRKDLCQGLSFDLNCMADNDEDRLDGSNNSSDLTVEHGDEHGHELRGSPTTSSTAPNEMLTCVDEAIIFKPVDFAPILHNVERTISAKFGSILGDKISIKIDNEALERITSGIWLGQTTLESWAEKVLTPSIQQLKTTFPSLLSRSHSVRLELDQASNNRDCGDWLPSRISVVTDAQ